MRSIVGVNTKMDFDFLTRFWIKRRKEGDAGVNKLYCVTPLLTRNRTPEQVQQLEQMAAAGLSFLVSSLVDHCLQICSRRWEMCVSRRLGRVEAFVCFFFFSVSHTWRLQCVRRYEPGGELAVGEAACLERCVSKYMDTYKMVNDHLTKKQQEEMQFQ